MISPWLVPLVSNVSWRNTKQKKNNKKKTPKWIILRKAPHGSILHATAALSRVSIFHHRGKLHFQILSHPTAIQEAGSTHSYEAVRMSCSEKYCLVTPDREENSGPPSEFSDTCVRASASFFFFFCAFLMLCFLFLFVFPQTGGWRCRLACICVCLRVGEDPIQKLWKAHKASPLIGRLARL